MSHDAKVLVVINLKGGVGKTTTALALSKGLEKKDSKVLSIDLDPTCGLSTLLSNNEIEHPKSILDVLVEGESIRDCLHHFGERLDAVLSEDMLASAGDKIKSNDPNRLFKLDDALSEVKDDYDFIVIDTAPELSVLTYNALMAADEVIIPCTPERLAAKAVGKTVKEIAKITSSPRFNPGLNIAGVLINKINSTSVQRHWKQELTDAGIAGVIPVFDTSIRESTVIQDAESKGTNIFEHKHRRIKAPLDDYKSFIDEYLSKSLGA